ncbi:large ribosomal subunit protein mL51 [Phymastichus coffea]|uniref:large ribosomal subunit protein mL51 n=1 Tax=Phymastichus coffea TaxID=108790 RepID=UPI00273AE0AB|nr:large ribosomal subunit protein mL51 [Phymastichus coffea]
MSSLTSFVSTAWKAWVPQITAVRFRYWADRPRIVRRYGYKDPIDQTGTLAHTGGNKPVIELPIYRPKNAWTQRKALFGINNYIDILAEEPIKVTKIMYNVPAWLRGVKGTEYHVLLKKRQMLKRGVYPLARPTKWKELEKRIRYLYKFMNRKTKTFYSNK